MGTWTPIRGIPDPGFGITPECAALPSPWATDVTGWYYVQTGGTNSGNGYPANPRGSIPSTLPAGAVVIIGGSSFSLGVGVQITANGTAANPCYIRGQSYASRPTITGVLAPAGSYGIVENLNFSDGVIFQEGASNHWTARHCEFNEGTIGLGTWGYTGTSFVEYVVLNDLNMHSALAWHPGTDVDNHAITLNGSNRYIWILNSTIHGFEGDGCQMEAQNGRQANIHHIYFGKNTSYNNKQSGVWVKHATDVIISENELYDFAVTDSYSSGQATGLQYDNDYIWFLFNLIHDCEQGIAAESENNGTGTHHYIIGNVIHTIASSDQSNPHGYGAIKLRQANWYVLNNTLHNYDCGISMPYSGINATVLDNLFGARTISGGSLLYAETATSLTSFQKNIVPVTNFRALYNGSTYTTLAAFQSGSGKGQNCVATDSPGMTNPPTDCSILTTSPAKDAGQTATHAAYTAFQDRYGFSIAYDKAGGVRPVNAVWDIGAYEYGAATTQAPNGTWNYFRVR
ncbi:MAG: right-handed parallel beta-helix repeat-containing protein [Bryobacteraceae bacterium]